MNEVLAGVVSVLLLGGCASSSSSSAPTVQGDWMFLNADQVHGVGLTLKADGTYVGTSLALTSPSSADVELEIGTYTAKSGTLTLTPTQSSCPGPDPASSFGYSFEGRDLVIAQPTGLLVLQPNEGSGSPGSEAMRIGCFDEKTGAFVSTPLGPVTN